MLDENGRVGVELSPKQAGDLEGHEAPRCNKCTQWVAKNKGLAGVLGLIIISCIVVLAVVPPVCLLKGCIRKDEAAGDAGEVNRLIVTFNDLKSTVKSKLPLALARYVEEISLSSGINIVSFETSSNLEAAYDTLRKRSDLRILLRDVPQYTIPRVDPFAVSREVAQTVPQLRTGELNGTLPGGAGRRLRQAPAAGGDSLAGQQWANQIVHAPEAWDVSEGDDVVVAVIDTGCDLEHPDLKGHLWVNEKEVKGNKRDDDRNSFTDDVYGYDFAGPCKSTFPTDICGPRPNPVDVEGHGSHCSGIIGAVRNNGVGIAGIAPSVRIMCLKVVPNDNTFYLAHILTAIDYAVQNGAHIISCSFGPKRPDYNPTPAALEQMRNETDAYFLALQRVKEKNMLLVAAAGNELQDLDLLPSNSTYHPCTMAEYFPDHVLCVLATDEHDKKLVVNQRGTNYGRRSVDIGAPGDQIISTVPPLKEYDNESWANKTGSSMATPLVAGIGALIMSVLGYSDSNFYKGSEARKILVESADKVPGLEVRYQSRVNALEAVRAAYAELDGVKELVRLSRFSLESQTVMIPGFSETFYNGTLDVNREDWDTISSEIVDASIRATSAVFNSFKQGNGTTLVMKSFLQLLRPGIYRLTVSTDARPGDVLIKIGQRSLESLASRYLLKSDGGWFAFELRYRNPVRPINITLKEPGGDTAQQYAPMFYVMTETQPKDIYYAPKISLSSAFQVLTRAAAGPVRPSSILPGALQLDMPYNYSAVVDDIAFMTSSELRSGLYRNSSNAPSSIVGLAHTRLAPPSVPMRFKVMCDLCGLYVNELLVLDVYDPTGRDGAVAALSNCVTFNSAVRAHELTLRFGVGNLAGDTGLAISWQPCNASDNGDGAYSVTTHTVSSVFWRPSSGVAAYVPGLQCDFWPYDETEGWPPRGAPLLKFRFPAVLMQTQRGVDRQLVSSNEFLGNAYALLYDSGCSANETASLGCRAVLVALLRDIFSRGERLSAPQLVVCAAAGSTRPAAKAALPTRQRPNSVRSCGGGSVGGSLACTTLLLPTSIM